MSTMSTEVKSKSYTLRNEHGGWLGQIVLTSDGAFMSITDWGNLSFAWRAFGDDDFRKFLIGTSVDYFGGKMYQGIAYVAHGRKIEQACQRFAEKILPALKIELQKDIEAGNTW
jgi:hypothetical protein